MTHNSSITCPECGERRCGSTSCPCHACEHVIEPVPKLVLRYGPLALRVDLRLLTVGNDKPVMLRPREAQILSELIRHSDQVCSRDHLLTIMDDWGETNPRTLDVYIFKIRKRIQGSGVQIVTIYGSGWILATEDVIPTQRRPYVTPAQADQAAAMVRSGSSLSAAARRLDLSHATVRQAAVRAGAWPRVQL